MNIKVYVYCEHCGSNLEIEKEYIDSEGDLFITVEPCEDCLEKARWEER
jgi:uncharacterized Zn finger protein